MRHDAGDIAWHTRHLSRHVGSAKVIVRARLSPVGEGLQVLVYTPDQPDLFARICGYFDQAGFSILDAKIHTASNGYALDTFQVVTAMLPDHYRELCSMVGVGTGSTIAAAGPLPPPSRGRVSRRVQELPRHAARGPAAGREGAALAAVDLRQRPRRPALFHRARAGPPQAEPAARQGQHAGRAGGRHLPDRRPGAAAEPRQIEIETELLEALGAA
jgi:[protein-PII] uridylyltransferase